METVSSLANSPTNCRRIGILVSAWVIGLVVWASGLASLAVFF